MLAGWLIPAALREPCSPALPQLPALAGDPLLENTSLQSLPAPISPPLLRRMPVRWHLGSTLNQCDLILTNYVYSGPISRKAHTLRFWIGMNVKGTLFNPIHLCWQFGGNFSPGQMESNPSLSTAPFIPLLPGLAWGPPAFHYAARTAVWPEEPQSVGGLCIGSIPLFRCALDFIYVFVKLH